MEKTLTVLGWFVLASLSLAIARQLSEQKTIFWNEGFIGSPADSTLNKPRDSYALLIDSMPIKAESKAGNLTAKACYETDFIAQNQRTGNFEQVTNNFKHKGPDSCSAPLTEMVNTIYKN
jgi:hypothetical protein